MRVLVTGASGFVGAAVKRAFERAGAEVVGVDVRPSPGVLDHDLADDDQLSRLFSGGGFEVVAHLAASAVGTVGLLASARKDPRRAADVNVGGTVRLLEAARTTGTRSFVYASSTTVYGAAQWYADERITEEAALRPMSIYGATKAAAEHLGNCVAADTNMTFCALRLPLVYGADRWYGGALATLYDVLAAARAEEPVTFELDSVVADWVHVEDAARAFTAVAALSRPASAYHLVGHSSSALDLAQAFLELSSANHVRVEPRNVPPQAVFPLIDDGAARRDFGFAPRYDSLEDAAKSMVAVAASTATGRGRTTESGAGVQDGPTSSAK